VQAQRIAGVGHGLRVPHLGAPPNLTGLASRNYSRCAAGGPSFEGPPVSPLNAPTMDHQPPRVPLSQLALRFISGKYQGGEFPLGENKEIIVGRSSDLDMVLVEDMVSRRHARIACSDSDITIEDLGSTNGTFVNGEKIKRCDLKEGDRVLIGSSIFKVVYADQPGGGPRKRPGEDNLGRTQARTMTGAIEEIPLPDVLQLLGSSKKTGTLVIHSAQGLGRMRMRKGAIVHATIDGLTGVSPLKSAHRMLAWVQGTFELEPADETPVAGEIDLQVHELLMEGLRQMDEFNHLRGSLPDPNLPLNVPRPLIPSLKDLTPLELEVFQIAFNEPVFNNILDRSSVSDLDTARALQRLLSGGYLKAG
jgi:hypothetical protein